MAKPSDAEPYRDWLRETGHDGLRIVPDFDREYGVDEFKLQTVLVVLDSHQTKSALGNSGDFDPENPHIADVQYEEHVSVVDDRPGS